MKEALRYPEALKQETISILDKIRLNMSDILKRKGQVFVGIAGGSVVGKTTVYAQELSRGLSDVLILPGDDYCIGNTGSAVLHGKPNLHVPEDYDPELLGSHLRDLRERKPIEKPLYSFAERERLGWTTVNPAEIVIVEGTFVLHQSFNGLTDIKVFILTDDHSRFIRRLIRQRRNPKQTDLERLKEYLELTYPHYHSDILPTITNADYVIQNTYDAEVESPKMKTHQTQLVFTGITREEDFLNLFPQCTINSFSRHYYTHDGFKPGEVLYVSENTNINNELFYGLEPAINGNKAIQTPCVIFNLDGEVVDLEEAGYQRMLTVRGLEITAQIGNTSIKFVKLESGASVVQVSCISQNGDDSTPVPVNPFISHELKPQPITKSRWEIMHADSK
ncbi:hypothetical protein A3I53_03850 [Candidatus Curtissbacteria bacterium RIFCSPLOWO2_02_FULL_40_13b]|uniref:Phosphoribulokinase/uridine kinase domain-containing protein n=1 Tax=Candidatus Curtissbacteria bacterium RIFCSPLOWO2_02_FULL_40_13b TaxID=1797733 RepID=A0A1F5HPY2_9BACT|nr:MAG: hypothetical protein A3I53_03850 [Candidatus Curtissbacteria bacterium RIFCSPLOWO2_02_FULL_40_13b]